jgi:hypothetical protein
MSAAELRELAERVAREAGAQLLEAFGGPAVAVESKSTPTDLVSAADKAAEELIVSRISAVRPDDGFLGEEGADEAGSSGLRWIVDPLDGTANFLFGIPQWAVSIAVEDTDGVVAGVVFDPPRGELWAAERDGPATLDARPVRGSRREELATALVATGFGYDACSPRSATSAASAPPPWTSRGAPPGASTPTTSAACTAGTSPRALWCASARASRSSRWRRRHPRRQGCWRRRPRSWASCARGSPKPEFTDSRGASPPWPFARAD